MSREVRKVPSDWKHPRDGFHNNNTPRYISLYDGSDFNVRLSQWEDESEEWEAGCFPSYASEEDKKMSYSEWAGERPSEEDYMPNWSDSERTHYMMYETTSEGSPISPAFETPEKLARWLADAGASSFGSSTASYESWLRVSRGGYAPSAVVIDGVLSSGVSGL